VIFHFAVASDACWLKASGGAEAEAGEGACGGSGRGAGHGEAETVRTWRKRDAGKNLLAGIEPIAVAVEIDPGVEFPGDGCNDADRGGVTRHQGGEKCHTIVQRIEICVGTRLAIGLGRDTVAEEDSLHDLMTRAIGREQRWIRSRSVAEVEGGGLSGKVYGNSQQGSTRPNQS